MKDILDQQATMSRQMAEQQQAINQQILAQNSKFELMMAQMREMESKTGNPNDTRSPIDRDEESRFVDESGNPKRPRDMEQIARSIMMYNSRIEFPPI